MDPSHSKTCLFSLFPLESFSHTVRSGEKFFPALISRLCKDGPPFDLQWPQTQVRSRQLREEERVQQGVWGIGWGTEVQGLCCF